MKYTTRTLRSRSRGRLLSGCATALIAGGLLVGCSQDSDTQAESNAPDQTPAAAAPATPTIETGNEEWDKIASEALATDPALASAWQEAEAIKTSVQADLEAQGQGPRPEFCTALGEDLFAAEGYESLPWAQQEADGDAYCNYSPKEPSTQSLIQVRYFSLSNSVKKEAFDMLYNRMDDIVPPSVEGAKVIRFLNFSDDAGQECMAGYEYDSGIVAVEFTDGDHSKDAMWRDQCGPAMEKLKTVHAKVGEYVPEG